MVKSSTIDLIKNNYSDYIIEEIDLESSIGYPVIYCIEKIKWVNENSPIYYIGSNYQNNPKYLGSSKKLKEDIKLIGELGFVKKILFVFDKKITKSLLREIESKILIYEDASKNPMYYNITYRNGPAMPKGIYVGENRTDKMKIAHSNLSKYLGENRTEAQKELDERRIRSTYKTIKLINEEGIIISSEGIGIRNLCVIHKLTRNILYQLINKKIDLYKGWKLLE
jgi:hypothetical protein